MNMVKYAGVTGVCYFVLQVVWGFVSAILLPSVSSFSGNIVCVIAASFGAASWFFKVERREPVGREKWLYALYASICVWIASVVLVGLVVLLALKPGDVWVVRSALSMFFQTSTYVVIAVLSLIYFFVFYFSFGWYTRLLGKRQE